MIEWRWKFHSELSLKNGKRGMQKSLLSQAEGKEVGEDEAIEKITFRARSKPPTKTHQQVKEMARMEEREKPFLTTIQIKKSFVNSIVEPGNQKNFVSKASVKKV